MDAKSVSVRLAIKIFEFKMNYNNTILHFYQSLAAKQISMTIRKTIHGSR